MSKEALWLRVWTGTGHSKFQCEGWKVEESQSYGQGKERLNPVTMGPVRRPSNSRKETKVTVEIDIALRQGRRGSLEEPEAVDLVVPKQLWRLWGWETGE